MGGEQLAESIAKAIGNEKLVETMKYIYRMHDIQFGDEYEESRRRRF